MENIIKLILDFAMGYPQVSAILLIIGGARAVFKPIVALAQAYVSATPSLEDDKILDSVQKNPIFKAVEFVLDYLFSLKKIK